MQDQRATTTAQVLMDEMFCLFGVPEELHSDQGWKFEAEVFAVICAHLNVKKIQTTPPHMQSNGLVECFNKTLAIQLAEVTSWHQ